MIPLFSSQEGKAVAIAGFVQPSSIEVQSVPCESLYITDFTYHVMELKKIDAEELA
jgi:hypothetical protein